MEKETCIAFFGEIVRRKNVLCLVGAWACNITFLTQIHMPYTSSNINSQCNNTPFTRATNELQYSLNIPAHNLRRAIFTQHSRMQIFHHDSLDPDPVQRLEYTHNSIAYRARCETLAYYRHNQELPIKNDNSSGH